MSTHISSRIRLVLALAFAGVLLSACDTGPADSLFDPDRTFQPDPVITRIEPETALAGIGTLTIMGENFSSVPEENLVFFGDTRATVLQASPTQLVVATPNLPRPGVQARVSVVGAEKISNVATVNLEAAVVRFGDIKDFEDVFGATTDADGNVYISLFSSNVSAGVDRITPEGVRSDYAASTFKWDALDFDDAGFMYGVRNVRAIFRVAPGGGDFANWAVADDRNARFRELDVDAEGNVWVGGSGGNIYRVTPAAQMTSFAVAPTINALKVAGGYVYVAEDLDGGDRVVRFPLSSGSLGAPEVIFTAPANVGILSLAVTADAEVLIGTDNEDPIFVASPSGSSDVLYPGLLSPAAGELVWDMDSNLYMVQVRTSNTGADIMRINTQRQAAH